ncbi:MAG: ABC transporter permease [Methanobacteriaceae archaeon]|nr:ABC transporter permease [Methanobacteriaceae archaeon]
MKIFDLTKNGLKFVVRDKKNLFFLLLFPAIFMLVFGFAFGGTNTDTSTYNIGILNLDDGMYVNGENHMLSEDLIKVIQDAKHENNEVKLFNVTILHNESEVNNLIQSESVTAAIIIPDNFSKNIYSSRLSTVDNASSIITIKGNPNSMSYGVSEGVLSGIISKYSQNMEEQILGSSTRLVTINTETIGETSDYDTFDFQAPGIIVFAVLMIVTIVAANISIESENGTLKRLKLSKMTSIDYIMGNLIPWMLISGIQVIILLLVAILIGFTWQGGFNSIVLAVITAVIGSISSVALALIIVSLTKSSNQATNLGVLFAVPLSFLVGSFFELPKLPITTIFGHTVQIYEILPWNHTLLALRQILLYGKGIEYVSSDLIISLLLGLILFGISIFLFSKKKLT